MALPIESTPILEGKEAIEFSKKIEKDLKRPTKLIDTPKIKGALKFIKKYASTRKKYNSR